MARLSAVVLLLPAWAWAQASNPGYEITGQDARLAGQKIFLLATEGISFADSTVADGQGTFRLRGQLPTPGMYLLRVGHQQSLSPVPLDYQSKLTATAEELKSKGEPDLLLLQVKDAPEQQLLRKMFPLFNVAFKELPANNPDLLKAKALLRGNSATFLAPYLAYKYLRFQAGQQSFTDSLLARFSPAQRASPYVVKLREALAGAERLAIGQLAPDLTLAGLDGQPLALSSLRGQYVLVDFWASWCKPCRAENPNLLAAYQKFKHKGPGFTVFAVSVDADRAKWARAVQEDGLPWAQVSDLQGSKGTAAQLYKAWAIPTSFLLDPSGKIIAKNLRGNELSRELARLLR